MKDSEAFEQQIHRIHELLEGSGAEVTWNDHVRDPDNLSRQRQVDVTIRRDGKLTLVECRDQQPPQDVTWIEELIGRQMSLGADKTIAVSSSAFKAGAALKAKRHGILLRDLHELTDLEIKVWGGEDIAITLYFYQYSDLEVSLCFNRESIPRLDMDLVRSELANHPAVQSLFNASAKQLGTLNLMGAEHAGRTVSFDIRLQFPRFQLQGESVIEVDFRGKACLNAREIMSKAVLGYGEPRSAQRQATVEKFSLGETSIVHDVDRISVFLDISQVVMPPFCQIRRFRIAGHNEMEHEAVELRGIDKLSVLWNKLKVNICST
jgi:hypothetical protein